MIIQFLEATETYIVNMFQAVQLCAMNSKRVMVMPRDLELVRRLRVNNLRALCKKFFQKNRKTTPTAFVQNCLRIPKLYLPCLSDHS